MSQSAIPGSAGLRRAGLIAVTLSIGWSAVSTTASIAAPQCQSSGPLVRIPALPEASGVAVSRRSPGRLWAHNDSGEAVLVGARHSRIGDSARPACPA